jgi:hypothetical protein
MRAVIYEASWNAASPGFARSAASMARPQSGTARLSSQFLTPQGALAKLFADVSAAGVNVEDVSIEHDPVREIGYLALSVAPEHADSLVETMLSHGWTVS